MATVTGTKRHLAITSTTYDSSGDVVVGGNLTVEGTTTTLDTANLLVEDKNIIIGNVSTPSDTTADGGGITLKGASDYTINWVNANNRWEFNQGIYSSGPITSAGQITGTELEGTSLDINGNADISGNLSGVDTLTATTLSVTNYGLVSGDIPNNAANTTGNAATATVADTLQGFDDRDVAPDDISFSEDLKLFFAEKAGIEGGTVASDYQDLLVLNSYADSSGGKLNALAFDKSTHRMLHYNANYNSTDWGTPKEIAYKDSDITGNAATVTSIGNLTGHITSTNRGTVLGSFTVEQLSAALSNASISGDNTGDQTTVSGSSGTVTNIGSMNAGDVTSGGTNNRTLSIGSGKVTMAKLANVATNTIIGRTADGTGVPKAMSATEVRAVLGVEANSTADQDKSDIEGLAIQTVGAITSGSWTSTDIAVLHGGTGASSASAARTNLGVAYATDDQALAGELDTVVLTPGNLAARSYRAAIGGATAIAVTHSLGTKDVMVQMYDASSFETVIAQVVRNSTSQVTVTFNTAPSAGDIIILVTKID